MPRPKSVPDDHVHAAIADLYGRGGDKAVTFATVSQATGLAPPTLVQRYGSRDRMMEWALMRGWDAVAVASDAALPVLDDRGAAAFLKAVADGLGATFTLGQLVTAQRSRDLQARAADWRAATESRLASSLGASRDAREQAAIAFAAWQGQLLWDDAGGRSFRLKAALRWLRQGRRQRDK
ncbi:MAG: transcriptional regulator [Pseudomonadota bacterium]